MWLAVGGKPTPRTVTPPSGKDGGDVIYKLRLYFTRSRKDAKLQPLRLRVTKTVTSS